MDRTQLKKVKTLVKTQVGEGGVFLFQALFALGTLDTVDAC